MGTDNTPQPKEAVSTQLKPGTGRIPTKKGPGFLSPALLELLGECSV